MAYSQGMAQQTEIDPVAAGGLGIRQLRIKVVEGPDQGTEAITGGAATSIGSHQSNNVILADTRVSRFHCEVRVDDNHARLVDVGSRNGTILDGLQIFDAAIRDESVAQVGRNSLRFEMLGSVHDVQLSPRTSFGTLVGRSVPMRAIFAALEKVAGNDSTVLILGPTGTGKEEVARSIHAQGPRCEKPFVVVDCGAVSRTLIESQLFGHVRGAFTGASERQVGAFEAAEGGTLFLDEVGELPLDLQPKLLRVLEERVVQPLGSTERIPVDFRLVAATHRDLRVEVNEKRFRSDLFFRMAVVVLTLPALRERPEDIPVLARCLLEKMAAPEEVVEQLLEPTSISELQRGAWPGNVRQLRNHLERIVLLGAAPEFAKMVDSSIVDPNMSYAEARKIAILHFEKKYVTALYDQHGGNVSAAARHAGVHRVYLHQLLKRHGVKGR